MSSQNPQVVDSNEFIELLDYEFTGNSVTVENKRKLIQGYRAKASIYHAAQFAGVARLTVYRYMDSDPAFKRAMDDSFEDAGDIMETSAYEDALGRDGKRGDSLLKMFWLKAHRPKFRDRVAVDVKAIESDIKSVLGELTARLNSINTSPTASHDNQPKKQLPAIIDVDPTD